MMHIWEAGYNVQHSKFDSINAEFWRNITRNCDNTISIDDINQFHSRRSKWDNEAVWVEFKEYVPGYYAGTIIHLDTLQEIINYETHGIPYKLRLIMKNKYFWIVMDSCNNKINDTMSDNVLLYNTDQ